MKTVGIIAEYNPFHRGHEYHIQKARETTGADFVVAVMSGDFVQRGAPAAADKHIRASAALSGGADLVLELPVAYACGSAEDFAMGAVSTLIKTGCVDYLCFGSEVGDIGPLDEYAALFEEEPALFRELLHERLAMGLSFPKARADAAVEYMNYTSRIMPCCADDADCRALSLPELSSPNDILGVEYLRALRRFGSHIKPVTVKRTGGVYNDTDIGCALPSAAAIRNVLEHSDEFPRGSLKAALPSYSLTAMENEYVNNSLMNSDDFSAVLAHLILSLDRETLSGYQDVGGDLASRIHNLRFKFTTFTGFADLLKTRQLTHTRISRALIHILLGLRQEDIERYRALSYPTYLYALGFRKSASPLLKKMKENAAPPLIVKPADARQNLEGTQFELYQKTVLASDIYRMNMSLKTHSDFKEELTFSPIIPDRP